MRTWTLDKNIRGDAFKANLIVETCPPSGLPRSHGDDGKAANAASH